MSIATTAGTGRWWTSTCGLAAAVGIGFAAHATSVPTGTVGLFTYDVNGQALPFIDLRVEHVAGQWVIPPFDVQTDIGALTWVAAPAGTYAISAIGNTGEPFPDPVAMITVIADSHDSIVPIIVPTPCPGDADDDRTIGVADLLALLADWGPCLDCPADTNDDDRIDTADLLTILAQWGPCAP